MANSPASRFNILSNHVTVTLRSSEANYGIIWLELRLDDFSQKIISLQVEAAFDRLEV